MFEGGNPWKNEPKENGDGRQPTGGGAVYRGPGEARLGAVGALHHPDFTSEFPQTGELIPSHEKWVAIYSRFEGGLPEAEAEEVHGGSSEAVHVVTPFPMMMPVITVVGSGDTFTVTGKAQYSNGDEYHIITILQLKESKILKETLYWASPTAAPEWRSEFVERITA